MDRMTRALRAVVIGEGVTPIACLNVFSALGNQVLAVSSPDEPLRGWADAHDVPYFSTLDELRSHLAEVEFDYLLSIVNYRILPEELLVLPRIAAINYHDAPLPRYAGTYATSWALLNGEHQHGVTWHLMVAQPDAGNILKQELVPIDESDTAASLNRKCFYAAVSSFGELTRELAEDTARPIPQDLAKRTYYGLSHRPENACLIDFDRSALQVSAFVRALSFGSYANPIGTPKVCIDGEWFAVGGVHVSQNRSSKAPGTIMSIDAQGLVVASRDFDVRLEKLTTLAGTPYAATDAYATSVAVPDPVLARRITNEYTRAARQESRWLKILAGAVPARICNASNDSPKSFDLPQPASGQIPFRSDAALSPSGFELLAWHARFLEERTCTPDQFVGYLADRDLREMAGLRGLFVTSLPRQLAWFDARERPDYPAALSADSSPTEPFAYVRDLALRHPQAGLLSDRLPIVFAILDDQDAAIDRDCSGTQLTVSVTSDGRQGRWLFPLEHELEIRTTWNEFISWGESRGLPISRCS